MANPVYDAVVCLRQQARRRGCELAVGDSPGEVSEEDDALVVPGAQEGGARAGGVVHSSGCQLLLLIQQAFRQATRGRRRDGRQRCADATWDRCLGSQGGYSLYRQLGSK